jgi:trehalose utilization protein
LPAEAIAQQHPRVTVWNEDLAEKLRPEVRAVYPDGIHGAIAASLRSHCGPDVIVRTATLPEADHGLSADVLEETDVLTWWSHKVNEEVRDDVAERVRQRVLEGMGLVVLHSAHLSKPFMALMGTRCTLRWREADEREIVWTVSPSHPIAEGVPPSFVIPEQEMYGEYFDIPEPDELVFLSSFSGGEVFRSGCCFRRGKGRIFFFGPGHETYPVYHQPEVQQIIANAVRWAHQPLPSKFDTSECRQSPIGWFAER